MKIEEFPQVANSKVKFLEDAANHTFQLTNVNDKKKNKIKKIKREREEKVEEF